ncbi:MAG: succinate--CoA ligase subunit alpha [Anaerolineae bacterium]|nr:succinate--CoA ligase subunit alpha [Anaerolineae bacterium]MDW8069651.1 succinate--CoA ligase subunit alpha [Anaerolineae bacterium]
MAILVDQTIRLVVQGVTGREGEFHTRQTLDYGTPVVAGVTPGKGGQFACEGRVPVFDTVQEAVAATGANTSVMYVPAPFAPDAIIEAADAGLGLIVCITEGIPVHEMIRVKAYLDLKGVRLIGPNSPGLLTPGQAKVGIMPGHITMPGPVGVVSRSGTLTYEIVSALTARGIGQTTCVGIGGDPIIGTRFVEVLALFEADPETQAVVLIGEIGGNDEEAAARFIAERMTKPVVAFIAGRTAPPGKRMGHAGAIIEGGTGTAAEKIAALEAAGVRVAEHPEQIARLVEEELG